MLFKVRNRNTKKTSTGACFSVFIVDLLHSYFCRYLFKVHDKNTRPRSVETVLVIFIFDSRYLLTECCFMLWEGCIYKNSYLTNLEKSITLDIVCIDIVTMWFPINRHQAHSWMVVSRNIMIPIFSVIFLHSRLTVG